MQSPDQTFKVISYIIVKESHHLYYFTKKHFKKNEANLWLDKSKLKGDKLKNCHPNHFSFLDDSEKVQMKLILVMSRLFETNNIMIIFYPINTHMKYLLIWLYSRYNCYYSLIFISFYELFHFCNKSQF